MTRRHGIHYFGSPPLFDCEEGFEISSGGPQRDERASADFEGLLMRVSTIFAGAPWHRVVSEVELALKDVLNVCCVDQASIFEVLPGNTEAYLRYVAGVPGTRAAPERFSYGAWFPWAFCKVVQAGEVLAVPRPDSLPAQAATDAASMRALDVQSLLHIPLRVDAEVRFVLTTACHARTREWPERFIKYLNAVGEIFAHAISRAEAVGTLFATRHDLRDVLSVVHLGRWEWDVGADKLHLSDEAKHIFGADVPVLGSLMDLVQPSDRRALRRAIEDALAHPGARIKTRYAVKTPAGERRLIQQWHELLFPGERTARLVATVQDVTAALSTEQEVAELRAHHWHSARVAQTALLVASLAHELCQPLAAILNNAQAGLRLLKSDRLCPDEIRDILTDVVASNRRASEVLSALRAMLRRQNTTRITFDAAEAARDVLALVRSELMSEQIEVQTSLADRCYLTADKIQIEQVLLNLVMNSIDSMRGKREFKRRLGITLSGGAGEQVEISVKDSGSGIPADKLGMAFAAFWTTKKKGLGMGLPVCRAIVESYGGCIWCENNDTGGVTFHVRLPPPER